MKKRDVLIVADYSEETPLTLTEVCEICHISSDYISYLIEYEIIHPSSKQQAEWQFGLNELKRIQTTLRLQRDLDVNLAGAAVVLDLLEELEQLRSRVELIHKHF